MKYSHLNAIIETDHFQPSLIIYNAGTDCLQGDRLGQLKITPEVFSFCFHQIIHFIDEFLN